MLAIPKYLSDAYPNDYLDVGELYGTMQVRGGIRVSPACRSSDDAARSFSLHDTLIGRAQRRNRCCRSANVSSCPSGARWRHHRPILSTSCQRHRGRASPLRELTLPFDRNQEPYFKFQVNVTKFSPYCFELITIDPNWNRNVLPSLVRNNRLNITIPYVGIYNYFTITMSKFAAKKPVFAYSWYVLSRIVTSEFSSLGAPRYPTVFWSIADMVRVRFKEYTSYCYRNYTVTTSTADVNGYSSVDCGTVPIK